MCVKEIGGKMTLVSSDLVPELLPRLEISTSLAIVHGDRCNDPYRQLLRPAVEELLRPLGFELSSLVKLKVSSINRIQARGERAFQRACGSSIQ